MIFTLCVECHGGKGCPRNGAGGLTCSSHVCKEKLKNRRAALAIEGLPLDAAAPHGHGDTLPDGMTVNEIKEILGERCCIPNGMRKKRRKNGPAGRSRKQQFLVRGSFLEAGHGDSDSASDSGSDDEPEPNTFWVDKDNLINDVGLPAVKGALEKRHKAVIAEL